MHNSVEMPPNDGRVSAVFTQIYDSDSDSANTAATPYDKFDVLYVAFSHINQETYKLDFEDVPDGGKAAEKMRLKKILGLTQALRAAGKIKVVISLGWGDKFNDIPLIEEHLATFAPSVRQFLVENDLDGFDIDYESPGFSTNQSFRAVAEAIRSSLGEEYLFTITPNNTWNLDGATLNRYFDYVNVQSYDAHPPDARCPVTNFTRMEGLSKAKILAGADTDNGDDVSVTVGKCLGNDIGGVFAWKLAPHFDETADIMWRAMHSGGDTGSFDDSSIIRAAGNPAITQLVIRSGDVLDSIQATNAGAMYPSPLVLPQHGGNGGGESTVSIQGHDSIAEISGYTGNWFGRDCVLQLTIKTRNGRIHGPYGSMNNAESKTEFQIAAPSGQSITAFRGVVIEVPKAPTGRTNVVGTLCAYFQ